MSEYLKDEDVKNYLRGAWFTMHTMSLRGKDGDHKFIIWYIRYIFENTLCEKCDPHAREILRKHPPEEAYITGGYEGLFNWTVDRHNEVNYRLHKPQVLAQDARLYYTNKTCKGCANTYEKSSEDKIKNKSMEKVKEVSKKDDQVEDFLEKHTRKSLIIDTK